MLGQVWGTPSIFGPVDPSPSIFIPADPSFTYPSIFMPIDCQSCCKYRFSVSTVVVRVMTVRTPKTFLARSPAILLLLAPPPQLVGQPFDGEHSDPL